MTLKISFGRYLSSNNQHTKFEMPSFTDSKDTTGAQNLTNGSRDHDHAPLMGGLSHTDEDLTYPTGIQNLTTQAVLEL